MNLRSICLRIAVLWVVEVLVFALLYGPGPHGEFQYRRVERFAAQNEYRLNPSPVAKAALNSERSLLYKHQAQIIATWLGLMLVLTATSVCLFYELQHRRPS